MGKQSFGGRGGGVDVSVAERCGKGGGVGDDREIGDRNSVLGVKLTVV